MNLIKGGYMLVSQIQAIDLYKAIGKDSNTINNLKDEDRKVVVAALNCIEKNNFSKDSNTEAAFLINRLKIGIPIKEKSILPAFLSSFLKGFRNLLGRTSPKDISTKLKEIKQKIDDKNRELDGFKNGLLSSIKISIDSNKEGDLNINDINKNAIENIVTFLGKLQQKYKFDTSMELNTTTLQDLHEEIGNKTNNNKTIKTIINKEINDLTYGNFEETLNISLKYYNKAKELFEEVELLNKLKPE